MTDNSTSDIAIGPPPPHLVIPGRRFRAAKILGVLAVICVGVGIVWANSDWFLGTLHTGALAVPSAAAPAASSDNLARIEKDFGAFQQQTGSSIQTVTDLLTAQQMETKRLADQVADLKSQVVSLSAKIDLAHDTGTGSVKTPAASPTAPIAPRKKPAAVKPAGAISVGGAPLASPQAR